MISAVSMRRLCGLLTAALIALAGCNGSPLVGAPGREPAQNASPQALRVVVMDPLSRQLACDCVGGYAQRQYGKLGDFLARRLGRPVRLSYAESLGASTARLNEGVDLIVGNFSIVRFDGRGRIIPKPPARTEHLSPDTSTPVVIDSPVFGRDGRAACLDLRAGLKMLWYAGKPPFLDYCTFIAGNARVLVTTAAGKVCLLKADRAAKKMNCISTVQLFEGVSEQERGVWSHPAVVSNRLYIRNMLAVYCFLLE